MQIFLSYKKPIVCNENEKVWQNEWGGKIIFSHGTTAARGVAVLVAKDFYQYITNITTDDEGRIIIFDIKQDDVNITVAAIYAPNCDNPNFFKTLSVLLAERHEHKLIIGDFNLVMDVELDRENTYNNNNKARDEVENLCDQYCLKDLWRVWNEQRREFSWFKKGSYPMKASRIDFALVSGGIDQKVQTIQYLSSVFTDHRGVYLVLDPSPFHRGVGYWKFNNSLLCNKEFLQGMNIEINKVIASSSHKTSIEQWELLKVKMRQFSVEFSGAMASEHKLIISELSEKINDYESRLPLNRDETEILENTRLDLEEKTLERIKGVMFRSKAKWYAEGEKNSKYFFNLEKARYNGKTCYKLITDSGEEVTTPYEIIQEQKKFYSQLYQKDEQVNFSLVNNYGIFVPENIAKDQSCQLELSDLENAIKGMKNNKTPGEDGLPVDFYKVFWSQFRNVFYGMVKQCFVEECLHDSARMGILNLIPKANKDTRYVKNLRPITLLNVDYKIIEKAIANKMMPALEHIINKDQRGFMKDRRISVNIRKMLDIMHQVEKDDLEAVVLSLDFVKCF